MFFLLLIFWAPMASAVDSVQPPLGYPKPPMPNAPIYVPPQSQLSNPAPGSMPPPTYTPPSAPAPAAPPPTYTQGGTSTAFSTSAKDSKIPSSDVYYYKDEDGGLIAVDSIDDVPKKYRAKMKKMPRNK